MAIFPNVCLWRRSYAQNWEVLTLKNCYSIDPPSYVSTAYVVASYGPHFLSIVRFVKIWATCENFFGKWFTPPPGKKFPVRLWSLRIQFQRKFMYNRHWPFSYKRRIIRWIIRVTQIIRLSLKMEWS